MRAWLLIALCLLTVGCGSPTGTISGKVTYQGKLLNRGTVLFISEKGTAWPCPIREDGSYQTPKIPVGPAKIAVQAPPSRKEVLKGVDRGQELPEKLRKHLAAAVSFAVPEHYANPDKSGLSYTVQNGSQEYNIELK